MNNAILLAILTLAVPLHRQVVCHSVSLILVLTAARTKSGGPASWPHLLKGICQAKASPPESWVLCQHPSIPTPKEFRPITEVDTEHSPHRAWIQANRPVLAAEWAESQNQGMLRLEGFRRSPKRVRLREKVPRAEHSYTAGLQHHLARENGPDSWGGSEQDY